MAVDATGTPTALGIPTFLVGTDAPTGNGGNAQMSSIDALIQGRVPIPGGIAAGEVPVWNGSTWVRSSVTGIAPSSIAATYSAYTPTWSSGGTQPAIGNAQVVARYAQIGKVVHAYGSITFGSTSTFGTGNYSFALPVAALANNTRLAGVGWLFHGGGSNLGQAMPVVNTTTSTVQFEYGATYLGGYSVVQTTGPWTWANGDAIHWGFVYEAA